MTAGPDLAPAYTLAQPELHESDAMMHLRAGVWREEHIGAGVSRAWVEEHTLTWDGPESLRQYGQYLAESLRDEYAYVRVVRAASQVVGIFDADTLDTESGLAYVRVAQLLPQVRSQGLGRRLFNEFEEAIEPGRSIRLEVLYRNMRARRFYEGLGFREVPGSHRIEIGRLEKISMIKERGEAV